MSQKHGLFYLRKEFACGFDIKFAVPAFVCILSIDRYFTPSTIEQMLGRANRAQGKQEGTVFLNFENTNKRLQTFAWYKKLCHIDDNEFAP